MRIHKRGSTCGQAARVEADQRFPLPRRVSATIEASGLRDATASEYRDKIDTPRRHVCGPTSGGPHAGRQRGSKWISDLLPLPRRASATTTLVRDRCPSTIAATNSPPSRWKALGASVKKAATDTDASSLARKGVCKKRLFQIISVTTQVAISRRVHR